MKLLRKDKGFTLIELLLVIVIIGLLLAVIVPRAWRANIDTKYGLVRQNCSELAKFGMDWAEEQLLAQNDNNSTARLTDYLVTLTGAGTASAVSSEWVANGATGTASNWGLADADTTGPGSRVAVVGRRMGSGTGDADPETKVEKIITPDKMPRNPFNGVCVFRSTNLPLTANPIPGAIACGRAPDTTRIGQWMYFGFVFQGTDSTTTTLNNDTSTFYANQGDRTLAGLRNGIFFGRVGY